jgi:hypothetical protein
MALSYSFFISSCFHSMSADGPELLTYLRHLDVAARLENFWVIFWRTLSNGSGSLPVIESTANNW